MTKARKRTLCEICSGAVHTVMRLPEFPLTGVYLSEPAHHPKFDTSVQYCGGCRHAQMETCLPPSTLYGPGYWFRTSVSPIARSGISFFLDWFWSVLSEEMPLGRVLEVGSNDLHLARMLSQKATNYTALDPIWLSQTHPEDIPPNLTVLGGYVEDSPLPSDYDIVISEHTLEHVTSPHTFADRVSKALKPDGLAFIEIPSLECLLEEARFDQFFHQHLNVFSLSSLISLFRSHGLQYVKHIYNKSYWGSLMVCFRKHPEPLVRDPEPGVFLSSFEHQLAAFGEMTSRVRSALDKHKGNLTGYGAAQILPSLAYHLATDLRELPVIYDEDERKHALYYPSLTPQVRKPPEGGPKGPTILLALDQAHLIRPKLKSARPLLIPLVREWDLSEFMKDIP